MAFISILNKAMSYFYLKHDAKFLRLLLGLWIKNTGKLYPTCERRIALTFQMRNRPKNK